MLALHKLCILIARDDSDLRVFALRGDGFDGRNVEIFTRPGNRVNPVFSTNFPTAGACSNSKPLEI